MDRHKLQHHTMLTDDAVAELLAKEASDASIKYSSVGLDAFKSTKYAHPDPAQLRLAGLPLTHAP